MSYTKKRGGKKRKKWVLRGYVVEMLRRFMDYGPWPCLHQSHGFMNNNTMLQSSECDARRVLCAWRGLFRKNTEHRRLQMPVEREVEQLLILAYVLAVSCKTSKVDRHNGRNAPLMISYRHRLVAHNSLTTTRRPDNTELYSSAQQVLRGDYQTAHHDELGYTASPGPKVSGQDRR